MAVVTPLFFDTSVLVGGIIELGKQTEAAQRIMGAVAHGRLQRPGTAWHCCLEFYAVTTRLPEELRLSPDLAAKLVTEELLQRFHVHHLPCRARRAFILDAPLARVAGGRIYDAHIAEIARRAQTETLVTENRRHFASLLQHGVRVLTAAEYVSAANL